MTFIDAAPLEVLYDFLLSLGLSLALWFCYHVLCLLFRMKNIVIATLVHLLFFAAAGVVAFCFIVGRTASREPRWHMALGMLVGALVYYGWFARYTKAVLYALESLLRWLVSPFVLLGQLVWGKVLLPLLGRLQKWHAMVYNAAIERRKQRRARRKRRGQTVQNNEQQEEKRKPVQAYTQS